MKIMEVPASNESFEGVRVFISDVLRSHGLQNEVIEENTLVFEELFTRIVAACPEGQSLSVRVTNDIGGLHLYIIFDGPRFFIDIESLEADDPGDMILRRYRDRVGFRYRRGSNSVSLQVRRGFMARRLFFIGAAALAILTYVVLSLFMDDSALKSFETGYVRQLNMLFIHAVAMMAAPVTVFSFVANITDAVVYADPRLNLRKLMLEALLTSIAAIVCAWLASRALSPLTDLLSFYAGRTPFEGWAGKITGSSVFEDLQNSIPENIVDALTASNPITLLFLGSLITAAVCASGKHFETLKSLTDAANALLGRMLNLIMTVLPAAVYLSLLSICLSRGWRGVCDVLILFAVPLVGLLVLLLFYLVRLKIGGVPPIPFLRECVPALRTSAGIGSAVDSGCYLTRFFSRKFKSKAALLDIKLPILTFLNADGHCFILMLSALVLAKTAGTELGLLGCILLGGLALLLSVGTTSSGGSLLISIIIIFSTGGISLAGISYVVLLEAFFGGIVTRVNVFADLVILAIDSRKHDNFTMPKPEKKTSGKS